MEISVFDYSFERVGTIEVYEQSKFTFNYHAHSELLLIVAADEIAVKYFIKNPDDYILNKSTKLRGLRRGFIVVRAKYTDETKSYIEVHLLSLSYLCNTRIVEGLQTYSGNVEEAIRFFVSNNAITPTNPNRMIPNLILGNLIGLTETTSEAFANEELDKALWEICSKFDISYDIFMDIENQKFVFVIWKGIDRSDEQQIFEPVIFSKEFDNVLNQSYTDDKGDFKNVAIISGDNETVKLTVNDHLSGFNRREIYFDEKNLVGNDEQSTAALLTEKANGRLALNYKRIQSFITDIDLKSQFVYGEHYEFGDRVTIRNDEIAVVMHTRIVQVIETYREAKFDLAISFGSSEPTPFEKIRKRVK